MPNLIGLAFSDLHIHKFKDYGHAISRVQYSIDVLVLMYKLAYEKKVHLFFAGDLFHTNEYLANGVHQAVMKVFAKYTKREWVPHFFAISGNHDLSERNGLDHKSPSHLELFDGIKRFNLCDNYDWNDGTKNLLVSGVPYMDSDRDLIKAIKARAKAIRGAEHKTKILLLHHDFPGAVTPAGIETADYDRLGKISLKKLFKPWDLVLCGHIHKPQRLLKVSKKAYMLGSPIHQIVSDEGTEMGYWEIYSDARPKFIHLDLYPMFKTLQKGETAPNHFHYYLPYLSEETADDNEESVNFSMKKSKKKLADQYCTAKKIKSKKKKKALKEALS